MTRLLGLAVPVVLWMTTGTFLWYQWSYSTITIRLVRGVLLAVATYLFWMSVPLVLQTRWGYGFGIPMTIDQAKLLGIIVVLWVVEYYVKKREGV